MMMIVVLVCMRVLCCFVSGWQGEPDADGRLFLCAAGSGLWVFPPRRSILFSY